VKDTRGGRFSIPDRVLPTRGRREPPGLTRRRQRDHYVADLLLRLDTVCLDNVVERTCLSTTDSRELTRLDEPLDVHDHGSVDLRDGEQHPPRREPRRQHLRSRRNDGSARGIQATTVTERAAISTWGIAPRCRTAMVAGRRVTTPPCAPRCSGTASPGAYGWLRGEASNSRCIGTPTRCSDSSPTMRSPTASPPWTPSTRRDHSNPRRSGYSRSARSRR
jgi:hypothetical protein